MKRFDDLTTEDKAGFVDWTWSSTGSLYGNPTNFYNPSPISNTNPWIFAAMRWLVRALSPGYCTNTYSGSVLVKISRTGVGSGNGGRWNICGSTAGLGNSTFGNHNAITEIVFKDADGNARYFTRPNFANPAASLAAAGYAEQTQDPRFYTVQSGSGGGLPPWVATVVARRRRKRLLDDDE